MENKYINEMYNNIQTNNNAVSVDLKNIESSTDDN